MSTHNICFRREIRKISAFFECLIYCYGVSLGSTKPIWIYPVSTWRPYITFETTDVTVSVSEVSLERFVFIRVSFFQVPFLQYLFCSYTLDIVNAEGHIAFVLFVRSFVIPVVTLYIVNKMFQNAFELGLWYLADLSGLRNSFVENLLKKKNNNKNKKTKKKKKKNSNQFL